MSKVCHIWYYKIISIYYFNIYFKKSIILESKNTFILEWYTPPCECTTVCLGSVQLPFRCLPFRCPDALDICWVWCNKDPQNSRRRSWDDPAQLATPPWRLQPPPDASKTPPRGPKLPQEAFKMPQEASKKLQDTSKRPVRRPKIVFYSQLGPPEHQKSMKLYWKKLRFSDYTQF